MTETTRPITYEFKKTIGSMPIACEICRAFDMEETAECVSAWIGDALVVAVCAMCATDIVRVWKVRGNRERDMRAMEVVA